MNYYLKTDGTIFRVPDKNELYHYGVKGMKWGVRKANYEPSSFTASNGVKVGKAKNGYVRAMRKVVANRAVENLSAASHRRLIKKNHADTLTNRANAIKGEQRIRKESAALREYNAATKDARKGTGTKYLDRAVRRNKLDSAYEKVNTASTRLDRFVYSDATRKKAAKYVVDKNMTVAEATKKAKGDARRSTAALVAAYGTITVASLYAIQKQFVEKYLFFAVQ